MSKAILESGGLGNTHQTIWIQCCEYDVAPPISPPGFRRWFGSCFRIDENEDLLALWGKIYLLPTIL